MMRRLAGLDFYALRDVSRAHVLQIARHAQMETDSKREIWRTG
jgi:hypothetical protein